MDPALKGIVVPIVTPFYSNGDVDEGKLRWLCSHLIDVGVHGIFPAGSTGEGWALDRDERRSIFKIVVAEVRGRVPVYGGTGAVTTREAVYLTQMAEDCGCDGTIAITPYYITPTEDELFEHFAAMCRATRLPVVPYNNPLRTGVPMSPDLVARLSELPNLAGIKDSSGNISLTRQFIERSREGFQVCQGRDELMYVSFVIGAVCAIAATACVVPELVLDIYHHFIKGEHQGAQAAQSKVAQLRTALAWGTYPIVVKEAMAMMGMDMGPGRAPVGPLTAANRQKLQATLRSMGVMP